MDNLLAPKGIDVEQQNYEDIAEVANEWFDEGDIDGLERVTLEGGDLRIIKFIQRQRVGFYLPDGSSFAVPEKMLQGKLTKHIYKKLVDTFGEEKSRDLSTPILVRSNAILYKRFEQLGFKVIRTLLDRLSSSIDSQGDKQENMDFLIGYLYNEALRTKGLSRLELTLNTNTSYYQNKANKLAHLQDGVGQWVLVDVRYHLDGYTHCSLGHRIKWEFVVEEQTTGERLSFGSTCIDDFFLVDSNIKGQIQKYKTYILNRLIEYAMQYDMGGINNLRVDRWVSAFGLGLRGIDDEVDYHLEFIQEFVKRGMLVPLGLQVSYTNSILEGKAVTQLGGYFATLLKKLDLSVIATRVHVILRLGYLGNLHTFVGDSGYRLADKNNDKLNLYGLKQEKLADDMELRAAAMFTIKDVYPEHLEKALEVFEGCTSYENYVTLVNNLIGTASRLVELQEKLYYTKGKYSDDRYKLFGITVPLNRYYKSFTVYLLEMNGYKVFDLLNVDKVLSVKLQLSKIEDEDDRIKLQVLHKLFSKKNLDYDMSVGISVIEREYYEELKPLFECNCQGKSYVDYIREGTHTGNLKKEVLQKFLEDFTGKKLEEVTTEIQERRVEAAKDYYRRGTVGNAYTNTVDVWGAGVDSEHKTEDGRWSESKVNLEELTKADFLAAFQRAANRKDLANRPLEFYRLVQHIILNSNDDKDIRSLVNEFGYKVLTTCIQNRRCSAKQLIYIDKLVKKLATILRAKDKIESPLEEIYLEIVYGTGK